MDVDGTYQHILEEIAKEHRALMRFDQEDLDFLLKALEKNLGRPQELEKILCLIEHSATPSLSFEGALIKCLMADLSPRLKVFALNCARKHVILARSQRGERLQFDFLEGLQKLLYSPSPEIVEWTLRTIEECGNQGVYFLRDFDKIKPPPWKWFNQHQRAVREIIAMLERRWGQFEKR